MTEQDIRNDERAKIAVALRNLSNDLDTDGERDDARWVRVIAESVQTGEVFSNTNTTPVSEKAPNQFREHLAPYPTSKPPLGARKVLPARNHT